MRVPRRVLLPVALLGCLLACGSPDEGAAQLPDQADRGAAVTVAPPAGPAGACAAVPGPPQPCDDTGEAVLAAALADGLCAEAAETFDGEVVAAYALTVADVRAEVGGTLPGGADLLPDAWDALGGSDDAAACYLDAAIAKAPPPALDGTVQPSFDRALVFAAAGVPPALSTAGYRDTLLPEPPRRP